MSAISWSNVAINPPPYPGEYLARYSFEPEKIKRARWLNAGKWRLGVKYDEWAFIHHNLNSNWRLIASSQFSDSSARLADLDFSNFWTDRFFAPLYLHVAHKTDGTVHRVFPRETLNATGVALQDGKLYWVVSPGKESPSNA